MAKEVNLFEKAEIINYDIFEYEDEDGRVYLYNVKTHEIFEVLKDGTLSSINIDSNLKLKIEESYKTIYANGMEEIC